MKVVMQAAGFLMRALDGMGLVSWKKRILSRFHPFSFTVELYRSQGMAFTEPNVEKGNIIVLAYKLFFLSGRKLATNLRHEGREIL